MNILLLAIYILSTSAGLVLLKLGAANGGAPISIVDNAVKLNMNALVVVGVFLYATSFMLYTFLISKYDLGFIIPLTTALVYVLIFMASFIIFKEAFTIIKIVAIALIILGVILLNIDK